MNNMTHKEFFNLAHNNKLENIQITEKTNINVSANILNDTVTQFERGNNTNYMISCDYEDKTVKASSNYLDENIINVLIEKGKYINSNLKTDIITDLSNNNDINDEILIDIDKEINEIVSLNSLREDESWVIESNITSSYEKIRIINDLGVDMSSSTITNLFECEVTICIDKEIKERKISRIFNNDINYKEVVASLISELKLATKISNITSGKYNVIINGSEVNRLIKNLIPHLSKYTVNKKMSMFNDMINKKIFSSNINIIEDPINKNMPGYRLFDDEGTKTKYKEIFKNGILKTYLSDNKISKEENSISTGNSYAEVTTRNMYLEKGNNSYDDLIKKLNNGIIIYFIVRNDSAANYADKDIAFQAYGLLVKNGKIVSGLKPFIVNTNYFELLNNVREVGNDLYWSDKTCASPSVIADNISITI